MGVQMLYKDGKKKAVTFSYDDNQIHDERLVGLFNRYGLKATFHLNSGTLGREGYVAKEAVKALYEGHEVACHGVKHEYLNHLGKERLVKEMWEDKKALEGLTGRIAAGTSYAYGEYGEEAVEALRAIGIQYARTVEGTNAFRLPSDFLRWHPTCHHNGDVLKKAEEFKNVPDYHRLPLFYIWGHSFEFEWEGTWDAFEEFCQSVGGLADTWYATNLEVCLYIKALKALMFRADESMVFNPTSQTVWMQVEDATIAVKPGEEAVLGVAAP